MAIISYIDNDYKYIRAFIKRDYTEIAEEIKSCRDDLNYSFELNNKVYGYKITTNRLLTEVYGEDFFVVHFYFLNIDTLHDSEQESCIRKLLDHLMEEITEKKGYFNLKLPANIVDLIRAYNQLQQPFIFCGGTVEQYIYNTPVPDCNKSGLHVFMADKEYVSKHCEELLAMTYRSFETYQGQYHLSSSISDKAGDIYKSWINGSLQSQSSDKVIVAEYGSIPIGYVTIDEDDFAVEGVLSSVSSEYRQYGAYKAMIAYIINYAYQNKKSFITGTQFDNFIVQGAWNSLGLRPFYSFYNIHFDNRTKNILGGGITSSIECLLKKVKKTKNFSRMKKLIFETVDLLKIDLSSMTVLTEAASGNFIVTPLIAAVAGAEKVYVVCRDSKYGTKKEILMYLEEAMMCFQIPPERICYIEEKDKVAREANIVTNLGFVRPIRAEFIEKMPKDSAIPLMFESWEFRMEDIDAKACKRHNIPILGTNERHPDLKIFYYVGMSILKLLLENNIEVFKSHILLISSGGYLDAISDILYGNGANVLIYNPYEMNALSDDMKAFLEHCDAVVVAEQQNSDILIGGQDAHIDIKWLLKCRPVVVHIAGILDYDLFEKYSIVKKPEEKISYGYMTVTTEYAGIRPVIELHAAGLKVGQAMVEGLRKYNNVERAKQYALEHSPSMAFAS